MTLMDGSPEISNAVHCLELREEVRAGKCGGHLRESRVHPCALICFSAEIPRTVSSFVAEDLGPFSEFRSVHTQSAAFA
jgi:hypothetical protein